MRKRTVFSPTSLEEDYFKPSSEVRHDFKTLYTQTCQELTLQQEKRDKTISIYVAVIAFLVPFLFSRDSAFESLGLGSSAIGWILVIAGVIGVFFSLSVVRYRIYKEVYWITSSVLSQLQNLVEGSCSKEIIQSLFLHCMEKRWGKFMAVSNYVYDENAGRVRVNYGKLVRKNINSAEFYMFATIALVASVLVAFGLSLVFATCSSSWVFVLIGAIIFMLLSIAYFKGLVNVFQVLSDHEEKSFNYAFGKAWFLHIYR